MRGYVGLPLATAFATAGLRVVCIDADPIKVDAIRAGRSYIEDVPSSVLADLAIAGNLTAHTDMACAGDVDAVVLCLPTPLSTHREPDLRILTAAARSLSEHLRAGQLVVLESTTFPGTTRDVLRPILESGGLVAGPDFHLAMSPERIDPGRTDHTMRTTPKIVGGLTPACTERAKELYSTCIETLVPVSSCEAAELTKLLENIFRSGQHRPGERARDALRPHGPERVGGRRRRGHQAVRLHALHPRARPGRALPAGRPVLPVLEGP